MANLFSRIFGSSDNVPPTDPIQDTIDQTLMQAQEMEKMGQWSLALETYRGGMQFARQNGKSRAEQFFLSGMGKAYTQMKDYTAAEQTFNEALNVARHLNDNGLIARSLNNLGELEMLQNNQARAQQFHEEALPYAKIANDPETHILVLENLARDYRNQNNASYAVHLLKEAVQQAKLAPQSFVLMASIYGKLGETVLLTEEKSSAENYLKQAVHLSQQTARYDLAIRWFSALGNLTREEGRYQEAMVYYNQAESIAQQIGYQSPAIFMTIALNLANIFHQTGNYNEGYLQAERALMHAKEIGNKEAQAFATAYLGLNAQGRGDYGIAQQHIIEALAYFEQGILNDSSLQMKLWLANGRTQHKLGDIEAARATFTKVVNYTKDSPKRHAEALQLVGMVQSMQVDRSEAIQTWKTAYQYFDEAGDKVGAARVLCDIANARRFSGDFKTALVDLENASLLLSSIDDRVTRGLVLSNAANLYIEMGDIETARSFYKESIQIARDLNDTYAESVRLGNYGWFEVLIGNYESAIQTLEKAIELTHRLNDKLLLAIQTSNIGYAYYRNAEFTTAQNLLKQAIALAEVSESERWLGWSKANLALVLLAKDNYAEAETLLAEALVHSQADALQEQIVTVQLRQAVLYSRSGRVADAETIAQELATATRKMNFKRGQADALRILGDTSTQHDNLEAAKEYYAQAYKLYDQLSDPNAHTVQALM